MDFNDLKDIIFNDIFCGEREEIIEFDDECNIPSKTSEQFDDCEIECNYDTFHDSQNSSSSYFPFEDNLDNELLLVEINTYKGTMWSETSNNIQNSFINFIKSHELELYKESYVEKYFTSYKCSIDEIVKKTRTQLWMDNCIYGLQFQAYICMVKDYPLPMVQQRNRKNPILQKDGSIKKKGVTNDEILECLFFQCKNESEIINIRPRDAPRNQIGMLTFLLDMLNHPYYKTCIKWEDKCSLTFKIINSKLVAYYWMVVKENDTCNFENFARGIRYLRHSGYFKQIDKKKQRTYQFNKKAIKEYKSKRYSNELSNVLFRNLEDIFDL